MTIRKKIIFLIAACFIIFMSVLLLFRSVQSHQHSLVIQSTIEQQDILVKSTIRSTSDQLNQLVSDYTLWDDIIYYMDHYSPKWGYDNIATTVTSFKLYSISVFNKDRKLVYGFGKYPLDVLGNDKERNEVLDLIWQKGSLHYFRRIPEGILEVSAANIHPTSDSTRQQKGYGFFFASKLWDNSNLTSLSMVTGSNVSIEATDKDIDGDVNEELVKTSYAMNDYNGKPVCILIFEKPYKLLAQNHKISDFVMYFLAALLLIILGIFFYILFRWIRRPLKIISETLKRGDTYQLGKLQKTDDEFSQIARLIIQFNQQHKQLELENAERKVIQNEMALQGKLLQGLAEASNRLLSIDNLEDALQQSVESLSVKASVDRIFIFRNSYDNETGSVKINRVCDWIHSDIRPLVDPKEYLELNCRESGVSLMDELAIGRTVKGLAADFRDPDLRTLLVRQHIKSIIAVPILDPIEKTLWGFTGFADCTHGHYWTESEETVLNMLASNIGGAIRRYMSQQELKDAMELARSADRAKSNFLASMSHEIRTPMNGVIGMTSLLQQTELTPSQKEYVETIESSGESLLNIINEILDFSKIESGHMMLEESPFDLRGCIEDVLDLMAPKIFEKRLEIIYYMDPKIQPYVFGDGFRLRQILVNLIGNAVKFTEFGEILVEVMIREVIEGSVILEFSVKDTGIGISKDKVDNLFKPFSQVDASTTRKYGGTGLGLAISANLIQMMEGSIWVVSEPGKGSDFRFTIRTYFTSPPAASENFIEKLQGLKARRILIVDDNATNRRILQLQCEYWGIGSIAVSSGKKALELIDHKENFDACILDMQMPMMDGEMLAREIRKRLTSNDLPLIMLTSIGFNLRTPEVQQLFSYYLNKPVKHSRLAEILYSILAKEKHSVKMETGNELDLQPISQEYPFKILIAEDNFINQKLIRNLFEVLGFRTDLAANGHEAIDALKRKRYDLIFMDVQMPEMDGYEATNKIKERWGEDGPVIIAMTANAMQGDREKCFQAGMDDYISKPLRLEDIVRVIKNWGELRMAAPYSDANTIAN